MREGSHFFEWTHKRTDGREFQTTVLLTRKQLGEEEMLQATVWDVSTQKPLEVDLAHAHKLEAVGHEPVKFSR